MSRIAQGLVDHVQGILNPTDQLPAPPSPTTSDIVQDPFHDHPRPPLPDWIPRDGPQDEPLDPNDGVIWEPMGDIDDDISSEADAVQGTALDVYAYYLPFHFYGRWWGIYIRAAGVLSIAAHVSRKKKISALSTHEINSAYRVLLEHEAFHHRVEMACTRAELPLLDFLRLHFGVNESPYGWYFWEIAAGLHEEAMANANAIRELVSWHRKSGFPESENLRIQSCVTRFMETQPPGYQDFNKHIDAPKFSSGKDAIVDHLRTCTALKIVSTCPNGLVKGRHHFSDRSIDHCPIYLVLDGLGRHVQRVRPFPNDYGMRIVVHTREHAPPHFHLERPVGKEIGRYEWPSLDPLKGASALSGSLRRNLQAYLGRYGKDVQKKLEQVYPELR
jgi:hypothetical protein